jgi:hypothetical protein
MTDLKEKIGNMVKIQRILKELAKKIRAENEQKRKAKKTKS